MMFKCFICMEVIGLWCLTTYDGHLSYENLNAENVGSLFCIVLNLMIIG